MNPLPDDPEILFAGGHTVFEPHAAELNPAALPEAIIADDRAPWVQMLEEALVDLAQDPEMRELYGDPSRGATLAQAWRTAQLFGVPPRTCLLDSAVSDISATGITTLVMVPRDELVGFVQQAVASRRRSSAQLFMFDGETGHCVSSQEADVDKGGVTFHDPWPGDSLLSAGQNRAGVAAQRRGDLWHLTTAELEQVLVAAFISPSTWAGLCGRPGLPTFGELQVSEFWQFFNIQEVGRDDADPTYVRISLEPGAFTEHIAMRLICYETDEICHATLMLRESWVIGPPWGINPFAKDIAATWLTATVPAVDRGAMAPLVAELHRADLGDELWTERMKTPAWYESEPGHMVASYLGVADTPFFVAFEQTALQVKSAEGDDGSAFTDVSVTLG